MLQKHADPKLAVQESEVDNEGNLPSAAGEVIFAWPDAEALRVRTAIARLP